jgi:hypothetical protein
MFFHPCSLPSSQICICTLKFYWTNKWKIALFLKIYNLFLTDVFTMRRIRDTYINGYAFYFYYDTYFVFFFMVKSVIEIYIIEIFCLIIWPVTDFLSYNVRYKHFKMDFLHKEVKNLLHMWIKCYFFKYLCLHFFGSVCCVASAT